MKQLYFGDCLEILRMLDSQHPDGFIDLVYIDPPFNSKRDYNVLFEPHGIVGDATAQKNAFTDTWSSVSYLDTLNEIQNLNLNLYNLLTCLDGSGIPKGAVAYLTTMAIRLHYIQKVLTKGGSFYLHCDQTMSHYLKVVCDLVFGKDNFRNEIVWKRTSAHNDPKRYGTNIDIILFFTKSNKWTWNPLFTEHNAEYLKRFRNKDDDGRLWQDDNLTAKGLSGGGYEYTYKGVKSLWRVPLVTMKRLDGENKLHFTNKGGIRLKRYLEDTEGVTLQCLWDDISPINSQAQERLGYPTQKPEELLDRIIRTSSNEGDLVADFFCGCGTTIAMAEKLNRSWIGVDISHLAIRLVRDRLVKPYKANKERMKNILDSIEIHGLPKDIGSAHELAADTMEGRLEFQEWAIEVMLNGVCNTKKTGDGGFDGYLTFNKTEKQRELVLIEVKSGNDANIAKLRAFMQTVKANNAAMGAFVCFEDKVSEGMKREAKREGYYDQDVWGQRYDKIQIVTIENLMDGSGISYPESTRETFKTASKKRSAKGENLTLDL